MLVFRKSQRLSQRKNDFRKIRMRFNGYRMFAKARAARKVGWERPTFCWRDEEWKSKSIKY